MNVLIATLGSSGDVNPFIAVGLALRGRGHRVTFLANAYFDKQVRSAGLEFAPLGEAMDLRIVADRPDLLHRRKALVAILDSMIVPHIPVVIDALTGLIRETRADLVLAHHTCVGAHWICERLGVPSAGAVLAPLLWPSLEDSRVFLAWEPQGPPPWYQRARDRIACWGMRWVVDRRFNRVRRRYGFPAGSDLFYADVLGGSVNLGLWSRHFRGSMSDDPPHGRICGFPWFDRHDEFEHASDEVEQFLQDGEPPIVFTLGSAAVHLAGDFYSCAAEACRILRRRGVLLTRYAENAPRDLPSGVRAFTYVPFSRLLPRACATVHHGGIGSTAQGMRAGRPTVIVPFCNDQFDNAARAQRLGVSATLHRTRLTPPRLADALRSVLEDAAASPRAAQLGHLLSAEDGALTAAIALEGACPRGPREGEAPAQPQAASP
jgi:MGT family glycosyltransferase